MILSGNLNDGAAGLFEIKRRGGVAIVQDPDDEANPDMPVSAASHVAVDNARHCPNFRGFFKNWSQERNAP